MKYYMLIILLIIFNGCGGNSSNKYNEENNKIKIFDNTDEFKIKKIDTINFKINNNKKDLYIIFTNTTNNRYNINLVKNNTFATKKNINKYNKINNVKYTPNNITSFNHKTIINKKNIINKINNNNIKKTQKKFYLKKDTSISTVASLKKNLTNINTKYGKKNLNIWVSDDSYGDNCIKDYCVKDYMIEKLAKVFLQDGEDNDIYDWVTNIFGEEWGENNNNSLINKTDEINILLTDINNDNKIVSGVTGYFYAKDNYKKSVYSGSNEKIMFYIDSVLFASYYGEDEWSIKNPQPQKIISTLAHEFEHMIEFYQKNVLQNNSGLKPWIDEMLAVSTEDIIATKLQTKGIRGVSYIRGDAGEKYNPYGKFSTFNQNINQTLPIWNNTKKDYAMVASFGAYLIRNYGGAKLLHDIMHNNYNDEQAIVFATQNSINGEDKNFDTLMQDWGIAVLLSSNTDLDIDSGYIYNLDDFFETQYNNINYSMGSINFFNYYEQPNIAKNINSIAPKSNLYYKIADKSTSTISIKINKNPNIKMALVSK